MLHSKWISYLSDVDTFWCRSHLIVTATYSGVVINTCGPHAFISSFSPQVLTPQVQRRGAFHVQSSIQAAVGEHGVADTYIVKERSRKWKEMWACFTHRGIIYSLWYILHLPLFLCTSVIKMNFFFLFDLSISIWSSWANGQLSFTVNICSIY